MSDDELIEQLADKEHASWSRWMEYLFSKCVTIRVEHGGPILIIPKEYVDHWREEIVTPYADLPEHIKQSDRAEVAHILPIIRRYTEERRRGDE